MDELSKKLNRHFPGRVVRKDLTKKITDLRKDRKEKSKNVKRKRCAQQ